MQAGFKAENALGYQQITSLSAAIGFTIPTGTAMALVIPETQAIRWRDDGSDPSATVGMPLAVGQPMFFTAAQLARVKFFEQAASAKLNISYYS